ncbi:carbohydrate ABC transporter permease [Paenibacillus cremeus]|uniref:Sugar ABC transporter permease n=1 Tax=Paenibacillus cremeus TaxID=2163881 RepID=A0A559KE85_9BACL|nr:sugar ABC transporter permease [Paenibacillus cremeus]TVY10447.1 sugar ABC transporter permease [Paenibacillus cremeus]
MDNPISPPYTGGNVLVRKKSSAAARLAKQTIVVLSFLGPALLFYGFFMLYPMEEAIRWSLLDLNAKSTVAHFVGLSNYVEILKDSVFQSSLLNNLEWVMMELLLVVFPVLILSVMITKVKRGKLFFRAAFYLPAVLSMPVVAVIWSKIYDPYIGPVNSFLKLIGLKGLALNWLGEPFTVLPALILASTWVAYGFYMVLYLAGLQSIDYDLYEAADLDGAGTVSKFLHITLPSLRHTINFIVSLVIINSFKGFSMVWIITQGGPFYKSEVVATYVYKQAFSKYQISTGAAGSVILALIIMLVTIVFNRIRERGE